MQALKPFLKIDETLSLHLARPELAAPVFEVVDAHRAYLRRWLQWVDATRSVEDTQNFMRESMRQNSEGSRLTTFILADGEVAGSLGIVHFNKDHRKAEMGYWLREDLQGRGLMTRAGAAFVSQIFRSKNLHRLEIQVAVGNPASRGVAQRLGFTLEGVHRQSALLYGELLDMELHALLKPEWESTKKKF